MTLIFKKLSQNKAMDLVPSKSVFGGKVSKKLRISRQSEGEAQETLKLREMASKSLFSNRSAVFQ